MKVFWKVVSISGFFVLAFLTIINFPMSDYSHKFFAFFMAAGGGWLSIQKYYQEQKTSRLQKLYLEDAFLGQIKAMEEIMSQITANLNCVDILLRYASDITDKLPFEQKKKIFLNKIEAIEKQMTLKIISTDFKKETILQFLCGAKYHDSKLVHWIQIFENDAVSFQGLLDMYFISFKEFLLDTAAFDEIFRNEAKNIHSKIHRYYLLVQRHYVLFRLLSNLIFEISNENFGSKNALKVALKNGQCKKTVQLSNQFYISLKIENTKNGDMTHISEGDAKELKEKINLAFNKIQKELFPNKSALLYSLCKEF